jgi:hypothetical protein
MTSPYSPVTVRAVLFGQQENAVTALAEGLSSDQVGAALREVSQATRAAAVRELSTIGAGLLDLDMGSLLVMGWRKYSALTEAARRTAETPRSEEIVDIVTHRISAACHPKIELLVNEIRVATIDFDLQAEFKVKALTAVIKAGHLVAIDCGHCETTVSLAIEDIAVATRTVEFDLHLLIRIGNGIPLLPTHTAPPPPPGQPDQPIPAHTGRQVSV